MTLKRFKNMAVMLFICVVVILFSQLFSIEQVNASDELDKDNLANGKYNVTVNLWNASQDKASMGNAALNEKALLTVEDGIYTMDISTRPMTIGTITSCLQTLEIKQVDGSYLYADITSRNNLDNQPSVFQFKLPIIEEYIDVKIDPKIEIMGKDPLPARLKISWDTLVSVPEDTKVEEDNDEVVSGLETEAIDVTDKTTKVRVTAEKNIVENNVSLKVSKVTSGTRFKTIKGLFGSELKSLVLFDMNFLSQEGDIVQPNGMVKVYIPIPSTMNKDNIKLYRVEDTTKVLMSGNVESSNYVFSTNKITTFALVELKDTSKEDTDIESEANSSSGSSGSKDDASSSSDSSKDDSKVQNSVDNSPTYVQNAGIINSSNSLDTDQLVEDESESDELEEDDVLVNDGEMDTESIAGTNSDAIDEEHDVDSETDLAKYIQNMDEKYQELLSRTISYVFLGVSVLISFFITIIICITIIRSPKFR